jgi:arsenate reductase
MMQETNPRNLPPSSLPSRLSGAEIRVILILVDPAGKGNMATRTKVLFLCIGNACRSQMAEAVAKHVAADVIEPSSAGLVAFGEIPGSTVAVLAEQGISTEGQHSKSLRSEDLPAADLLINMTGWPRASIFTGPTPPVEDWEVGDPYGSDLAVYRAIRDQIEARVDDLAQRLRDKVNVRQTA